MNEKEELTREILHLVSLYPYLNLSRVIPVDTLECLTAVELQSWKFRLLECIRSREENEIDTDPAL